MSAQTLSLHQISQRLERAVAASTADETELVWIETRTGHADSRSRSAAGPGAAHSMHSSGATATVVARVVAAGRGGWFQTSASEPGELEAAIRQAVAGSRATERATYSIGLYHGDEPVLSPRELALFDSAIAQLDEPTARQWLLDHLQPGEQATLHWSTFRMAVANSHGLKRRAKTTTVSLQVHCGPLNEGVRTPGAGSARASTRSLAALDPAAVFARARGRHFPGINGSATSNELATPPDLRGVAAASEILLLSPEAVGDLVWQIGLTGLAANAFYDTPHRTRLADWLGKLLFSRQIRLIDDGTLTPGLPFPFDYEGRPKQETELIADGVLTTPTVDRRLATEMGLSTTPHRVGPLETRPAHLHLAAGDASQAALLAVAEGGTSIDRLERLEIYDPARLRFRAHACGLRRIRNGALGAPIPDIVWEDSLDRIFRDVAAIGADAVSQARNEGIPGGVTAPSLILAPPGVRHS